ncbi:unnamed protein product [Effrenium voratum]|nr:unnamed protein product [Effrenium voratum]
MAELADSERMALSTAKAGQAASATSTRPPSETPTEAGAESPELDSGSDAAEANQSHSVDAVDAVDKDEDEDAADEETYEVEEGQPPLSLVWDPNFG